MNAKRLRALRAMSSDFQQRIDTTDPDDLAECAYIALIGGALAGFVPELLDCIEQLQAGSEPSTHLVKFDGRGGSA